MALFCLSRSSALIGGARIVPNSKLSSGKVALIRGGDAHRIGGQDSPALFAESHGNTVGMKRGNRLDSVVGWYNFQLEKRPLTTKVVSAGLIGAFSDILTQLLVQRNAKAAIDVRRLAVFTSVCAFYFAPVVDAWFTFLAKVPFPKELSENGKALAMVGVDQTVGAALVTSGFFFALELVSLLER